MNAKANEIKLFHAPQSRSVSILWLLEELGVPFSVELMNFRAEGGVPESYRKVQPNKKVPALAHAGAIVHERAAISLYLCELFPEKKLAPPVGSSLRGQFLSRLVYMDSVFDPALAGKVNQYDYPAANYSFGSFEDMLRYVESFLSQQPYAVGDEFSAVDVQLASGLFWGLELFKAIPDKPVFRQYVERVTSRPAFGRAMARDQAFAESLEA